MRTIPLFLALAAAGCGMPGTSSSSGMGTCAGQCAPSAADAPAFMVLLWSGPEGATPPDCPDVATTGIDGYLDTPPSTVECEPPCTCSASGSGCYLPSMMVANPTTCPG